MDAGEGDPIIILHGAIYNFLPWTTLVKDLSTTNRIIIPRLPFHIEPISESRLIDIVDYLYYFIHEHTLYKSILLGSGCGAQLALNYTKEFPDTIRKLVLTRPFDLSFDSMKSIVDERPGSKEEIEASCYIPSDLFPHEYTDNPSQEQEHLLKDMFFRFCPSRIPATLILSQYSMSSLQTNEIVFDAYMNSPLRHPAHLITHIRKFLLATSHNL